MATTRTEKPEKRLRKKKTPPKKFRLSYSLLLLFAMLIIGSVAGVMAYNFGKQALDGVNPSPAGVKLPKISPISKPTDKPKATPQDGKTSFLLDESEIISEMKTRSQNELGGLTRPAFVAKTQISDRKKMYTKVDRVYNSMRDPLAISANSDERIGERIAALRQRVYTSSRFSDVDYNQFGTTTSNNSSFFISTPVEIAPIRSKWSDRDLSLGVSRQVPLATMEVSTKPTNSSTSVDQPIPSTGQTRSR